MAKSYIKNVKNIGEVLFERSERAKRIIISIRPFKPIRVAVPQRVSYKEAEAFFISQLDWILGQKEKMVRYEQELRTEAAHRPEIDRGKARAFLAERLAQLARHYGFTYNRVAIRNQKTRWGSCSADNNINLNINLVRLPLELIDYVILHELMHTRVKNHSRRFWAELEKLVGDCKIYRKQLGQYRLDVV